MEAEFSVTFVPSRVCIARRGRELHVDGAIRVVEFNRPIDLKECIRSEKPGYLSNGQC